MGPAYGRFGVDSGHWSASQIGQQRSLGITARKRDLSCSVLAGRFRADFLAWVVTSPRGLAQLKHGAACISEIDLALAMGDQHPVRKKEVGAEQHRSQSELGP